MVDVTFPEMWVTSEGTVDRCDEVMATVEIAEVAEVGDGAMVTVWLLEVMGVEAWPGIVV